MTAATGKPRLNRKRWPDHCEKCNAEQGRPCTTPKGKQTDDHLARRDPTRAKQRPIGRPGMLTPEVQQQVCEALEQGVPINAAALAAGISGPTLHRWLARADTPIPPDGDDDPDAIYRAFREAATRARASGQVRLVGVLTRATEGGWIKRQVKRTLPDGTVEEDTTYADPDWKAAAFALERSYGREWGRRQQLDLTAGDSLEPTLAAAAGAGPGLDSGGVERVASNLATFRERKQLEQQRAVDPNVVDGEVVP